MSSVSPIDLNELSVIRVVDFNQSVTSPQFLPRSSSTLRLLLGVLTPLCSFKQIVTLYETEDLSRSLSLSSGGKRANRYCIL